MSSDPMTQGVHQKALEIAASVAKIEPIVTGDPHLVALANTYTAYITGETIQEIGQPLQSDDDFGASVDAILDGPVDLKAALQAHEGFRNGVFTQEDIANYLYELDRQATDFVSERANRIRSEKGGNAPGL